MNETKRNGRTVSMPAGIVTGAAVSIAATLAGAAILALMLDREIIAWEQIGYGILILLPLAAAIGTSTAYKRICRQRMAVCLLSAAAFWGILLAITALFFGGRFEAVGVTGGLILAGSGCVMLLGGREKRAGKRRNRKNIHR